MEQKYSRDIPRAVGALALAGFILAGSTPVARGNETPGQPSQPDATPTPIFRPDFRPRIEDLIVNASSLATPTATLRAEQLLPVNVAPTATRTPQPIEIAESDNEEERRRAGNRGNTKNRTGGDNDNNNSDRDNDNTQKKTATPTPFRSCIPTAEQCGAQPTQRPRTEVTLTATPFRHCKLPGDEAHCGPKGTGTPRIVMTITPTQRPTFTITPTPSDSRSCKLPGSPEHCGPQPTQRPRQATPTSTPFRSCMPISGEQCRPQSTTTPRQR